MIYWTSTEVLLNLVAPLDLAVPSLDFEQFNVILTSGFDSVSIVFDSLSVNRSLPELYFSHFWFGYLVGVTCSRSQELTLVVFFT